MQENTLPEAVRMSPTQAIRLSAWAMVAVAVSIFSRWLLARHPEWSGFQRAATALAPLAPGLLWVRSIAAWMRPLDELQRRIQSEAWLFAATGTVFLSIAIDLLASARLDKGHRIPSSLGWEGAFATAYLLYCVGCINSTRRYQ